MGNDIEYINDIVKNSKCSSIHYNIYEFIENGSTKYFVFNKFMTKCYVSDKKETLIGLVKCYGETQSLLYDKLEPYSVHWNCVNLIDRLRNNRLSNELIEFLDKFNGMKKEEVIS
jgi:hypothetical protein